MRFLSLYCWCATGIIANHCKLRCVLEMEEDMILLCTIYKLAKVKKLKKKKHRWWVHSILWKRSEHGTFYHLVTINFSRPLSVNFRTLGLFCISDLVSERERKGKTRHMTSCSGFTHLALCKLSRPITTCSYSILRIRTHMRKCCCIQR